MRVLALDIETAPNVAYTWGLWGQDVSLKQLIQPAEVMCFAAKWLGRKRVEFYSAHHHGREQMVAEAHRLLDEADVVLHYNGARFDIPHLNREFVEAGMPPPSPYAEIDLLKVVRRQFKFQSNKLEHVSRQLGLEGKVENGGFQLWVDCLAGDEKAWRMMRRYNRQDVVLLEELYDILQPWIPSHPSRLLHDGSVTGCPRCGSQRLESHGWRHTAASSYRRWKCRDCGGYSRSTKRDAGAEMVPV